MNLKINWKLSVTREPEKKRNERWRVYKKVRYLVNEDKRNDLQIIEIPEDEKTGKEKEWVVEEIENLTLWKKTIMQIQEAKRILNIIDINRTSRHIVIKMANKQRGQTSESSKGEDKPQING